MHSGTLRSGSIVMEHRSCLVWHTPYTDYSTVMSSYAVRHCCRAVGHSLADGDQFCAHRTTAEWLVGDG